MTKRTVLYLRVSTLDQRTSNQELELRQVAERTGYEIVKVYRDHGISGAKGRDNTSCGKSPRPFRAGFALGGSRMKCSAHEKPPLSRAGRGSRCFGPSAIC